MEQEAKYIADELETLGQHILAQFEGLPEYILHWPPPFPTRRSLFTLALEAITIIEEWVMLPVNGTTFFILPCSKKSSMETFIHSFACRLRTVDAGSTLASGCLARLFT